MALGIALGVTAGLAVAGSVGVWTLRRLRDPLGAPGSLPGALLDGLRNGVVLLGPEGRVRRANRAFAALVREPPERLPGRPVDAWLPGLDLRGAEAAHEREVDLAGAEGARIPVSVTAAWLRDRRDRPRGVLLEVRDLREVVALRRRVVTSGRLAAVGELATGIAHEINDPLAYLRSNLGVLRNALEDLAEKSEGPEDRERLGEGRELVEESLEGTDRIARVVRDLRTLAGPSSHARELVDVNALLEAAIRMLQPHLRFGARVERRLSDVPLVAGSPAELQHVFLAVLLNAGRTLGPQGAVEITTRTDRDAVVIGIEDDGCGMPAELQERAFDPFFRVSESGEASGLDLAVAWEVVRRHDGQIALDAAPGRGTRIRIRLPAAR